MNAEGRAWERRVQREMRAAYERHSGDSNVPGARPYRLEYPGTFSSPTFARLAGATEAASKLPKGTAWKIVKRLNKSGTKRELIAEGVT